MDFAVSVRFVVTVKTPHDACVNVRRMRIRLAVDVGGVAFFGWSRMAMAVAVEWRFAVHLAVVTGRNRSRSRSVVGVRALFVPEDEEIASARAFYG